MVRRPPRSPQSRSSAASDVYKRQGFFHIIEVRFAAAGSHNSHGNIPFGIVRLAEAFCPAINKPGPFIFVSKPQLQSVIFKQFYHPPYLFIRSLHFSAPVSYTHLRAHETRHDLVCRLLLEKKKYTHLRANETDY